MSAWSENFPGAATAKSKALRGITESWNIQPMTTVMSTLIGGRSIATVLHRRSLNNNKLTINGTNTTTYCTIRTYLLESTLWRMNFCKCHWEVKLWQFASWGNSMNEAEPVSIYLTNTVIINILQVNILASSTQWSPIATVISIFMGSWLDV